MKKYSKILIAGIPRSGTTLVYESLKKTDLIVAKTHLTDSLEKSIEGKAIDSNFLVLFLFGDALKSVFSTQKRLSGEPRWARIHSANCGCFKNVNEIDIISRDDLNYENIFDSWVSTKKFDVMTVRYEKLYNLKEIISAVIGRDLNLPGWRPRNTKISNFPFEKVEKAKQTYQDLIQKIATFPDFTIRLRPPVG